jgi:uncharacterized protein (TIGR02302 family)
MAGDIGRDSENGRSMAQKPAAANTAEPSIKLPRLMRTRAATRAAIVVERLWPLALPALLVLGLFLAVAWFGLLRMLPDWPRYALGGLFVLALLAALWPLRSYRRPEAAEVDRRIERFNALQHAPITTQGDRLSGGKDDFADALWREHQRRMAARLGAVDADLPRTDIPERDPWGLRAAVALLLVVAFAFSGSPYGGSVLDVFRVNPGEPPVPARIDAWVTPPPYTGRAPLFLTSEANAAQTLFSVPEGSDFALRITGGTGAETMAFMDAAGTAAIAAEGETAAADPKAPPAAPAAARQFGGKLTREGVLSLLSGEETLRSWTFQVTPDHAPVIRFTGEPKRAVNGTLELTYEIEDDYGAVEGKANFAQEQADAPGARPLYKAPDMPLTLPRRNGGIAARTVRDLTEHPWAGSTVTLHLTAKDAAGQQARSEAKTLVLPQRPFSNPLAKALVEMRRMLALDANSRAWVLRLMDAVTLRPEETIPTPSHYLGVRAARTRLFVAGGDEQLREVVDYLWEIALAIEDGALSAAERRMRQAQEALRDALENGASDEEIDRLMAELREAMNEFLREFAERAMRDPNFARQQQNMQQQNGQEMRQSDLDRMLDQIEQMAKSGARDQAQQLLSQLQDMMNNLRMGQQQQAGEGGQQGEMRQQMDRLGELMRRQQELMNETFQMDQMQRGQQQRGRDRSQQRGQGQQGQQGQQPGQGQQGGGQMSPEEFAEALRQLQQGQGQLQQDLQALMEGLRGMGIEPGEGFGEAGEAMGDAEQSLGQGQGEQAVGQQGQALEALRRGAQDMMNQMQAMQGQQGEQGGSGEGGRQRASDRDPLGRPRATTGPDFGNSVQVPDEIDTQRARQILEAIRKRLGNALSPELERDYLERLLQMR